MEFIDQLGRTISLDHPPRRIVSLVPSQTELLSDLGLNEEVVGITKFCVHPRLWFREKTRIGGTKEVTIEKVMQLSPDLILANKEENTPEDIERLALHCPVWISDIRSLDAAMAMIDEVGRLTGRDRDATHILKNMRASFARLDSHGPLIRALYLIWKNPYMVAGRDTFIDDMLSRAGFDNALTDVRSRYPVLSREDIEKINPEVLLLSSEPFPFKGKHAATIRKTFPGIKAIEVDGELFSWYGSRLLRSPDYFVQLKKMITA